MLKKYDPNEDLKKFAQRTDMFGDPVIKNLPTKVLKGPDYMKYLTPYIDQETKEISASDLEKGIDEIINTIDKPFITRLYNLRIGSIDNLENRIFSKKLVWFNSILKKSLTGDEMGIFKAKEKKGKRGIYIFK
jgi:hypothetical protein